MGAGERMDEAGRTYGVALAELHDRWPDAEVVPSLDREAMLVDMLGSPHLACPVVHIGGTNGKSSVARMVDALVRTTGLRSGRFTSPEFDLAERIALHGRPVPEERFVALYEEIHPYLGVVDAKHEQRLTAFEVMTAMAFAAFADAPVDVAVVEVGMGGAWDCTNVTDGRVAVLTPIGLDHEEYLGDSLESIAAEKVMIIKPNSVAVLAQQHPVVERAVLERCAAVGATLAREGQEFGVLRRSLAVGGQVLSLQGLSGTYDDVFLPLHGAHQAQNAAVALAAVEAFLGAGTERSLDPDIVRAGFAEVTSPGRLERVRTSPTIVLDAAHNPAGMAAIAEALREEFGFRRLVAVVSVLVDKDARTMLEILDPVVDAIVVTRNSSPRALPAAALGQLASEVLGAERVLVRSTLPDAIDGAVTLAESEADSDLGGTGVVITGSVVTVADARRLLVR